MNKGEVRVLLGSTGKMGTGTNCQKKLIALHNLDIPWRPSDLQQRIGRIERQGNQNSVAHVFNYVTKAVLMRIYIRHWKQNSVSSDRS